MTAFYRRYRPENFGDVIAQEHVTTPLKNALVTGKSHHAYLFSGPRGCGKTTSARILAKCWNCHEGPTDTPCGSCPSCVELSNEGGGSLDVVEIDAASHNGVDDARELRERAVFAPARDRYKIFILDEAHMVTQQGFNALLKIVEEPPEHVRFVFATTEPDKVLTTIRSRTHHYPFRLVPPGELVSYLGEVCQKEGVSPEDGVLALVARASGGSVRDALSLLDQLVAGSPDTTIGVEYARGLLGYTPQSLIDSLVRAIAGGDAPAAFHAVDTIIQSGHDPRRFSEDFLSHLRDLIVLGAVGDSGRDLFPGVGDGDLTEWTDQADVVGSDRLVHMADLTSQGLQEMSGVTAPRLQLELLVARMVNHQGHQTDHAPSTAPAAASAPQQAASTPTPDPAPSVEPAADPDPAPASDSTPAATPPAPTGPLSLELLHEKWSSIVGDLAEQKRSLWVALSETTPTALDDDVLTIGFPRRSDAEILKKPQGPGSPLPNADLLRDAIEAHTGHRVRFTIGDLDVAPPTATSTAPSIATETASVPVVDPEPAEEKAAEAPTDERVTATESDDSDDAAASDDTGSDGAEDDADAPPTPDRAAESPASAGKRATRGEPVIREVFGGQLIGEEILDSMGDGELSV